jgi:hypothetical protein
MPGVRQAGVRRRMTLAPRDMTESGLEDATRNGSIRSHLG